MPSGQGFSLSALGRLCQKQNLCWLEKRRHPFFPPLLGFNIFLCPMARSRSQRRRLRRLHRLAGRLGSLCHRGGKGDQAFGMLRHVCQRGGRLDSHGAGGGSRGGRQRRFFHQGVLLLRFLLFFCFCFLPVKADASGGFTSRGFIICHAPLDCRWPKQNAH